MDSGRGDNLVLALSSCLSFWKGGAKVLLLFCLCISFPPEMKGMDMHWTCPRVMLRNRLRGKNKTEIQIGLSWCYISAYIWAMKRYWAEPPLCHQLSQEIKWNLFFGSRRISVPVIYRVLMVLQLISNLYSGSSDNWKIGMIIMRFW